MNRSNEEIRAKHWEVAVDSIGDLLVLVDCRGKIVRGNRAVERWHLAPVVELPGMDVHRLFHGECDDPSCYLRRLDPEASHRISIEQYDPRLSRWVHLILEPLAESDWFRGLPEAAKPCTLLTVRDLTETRNQHIREGRRTRFEALHFVARNLAHQIGNPLAAMRTTTEVLAENISHFEPAKVDAYLSRILEGTERLQTIVERTLREQQFTELTFEAVPLNTLVDRMHRLFEDDMVAEGVTFELAPSRHPEPLAFVDPTAAEEVLVNVLRNALQATPAGGSISLGSHSGTERTAVVIRDTGRGMDRRQMANLFQPFFTTKPEGLGIGLAYSSYLMRKMKGSIGIDSELGRGTTVTLEFPNADAGAS